MTATSIDAVPSREQVLALSGLEFLIAIRDGAFPQPPIGAGLNYFLSDVSDGRAVFAGTPGAEHCNPLGTVHGGWYGTLLDSAMSCAVHTRVPAGSIYTTLEYKVNVTRTIPLGMQVLAEGLVQHSGRTTGVAMGTIRGAEDGKIYATGSATCLIMKG